MIKTFEEYFKLIEFKWACDIIIYILSNIICLKCYDMKNDYGEIGCGCKCHDSIPEVINDD